jgi:hypothetical protein
VIHRIGDSGRGPDIAEFTDALDAYRIDEFVLLRHQNDVDILNVGVHRNEIIGEIVVGVTSMPRVDFGCFVKRRRNPPRSSRPYIDCAPCGYS